MPVNNASYGLSLQKVICDTYKLKINDYASGQFNANFESEYQNELTKVCKHIFTELKTKPVQLLTYTKELTNNKQTTSPHNFLLANGKTLSVRTTKSSDKVAPRTIGQAGFPVLNEFFEDIYGRKIKTQNDIKNLIINHISEILPIFIDNLFQSDYTVFLNQKQPLDIQVFKLNEVGLYTFSQEELTFTRGLNEWTESTTLKYQGISIAEIQTHAERTFKFRFIVSAIPQWFRALKENNESLGMSAEAAICEKYNLPQPDSFKNRTLPTLKRQLIPVIQEAFNIMPKAIKHTGSESGERKGQSKCSYDFILEGDKTMSLKTNKGRMVCPPEVGQPAAQTCFLYFKDFFPDGTLEVTNEVFKKMVFEHISDIMPIYVMHLFDSDWLLWIYQEKNEYNFKAIKQSEIADFKWEAEKFSFSKNSIEQWNESNTVKYNGLTIGEFQVHTHRSCFKFRFRLDNLLSLLNNPTHS